MLSAVMLEAVLINRINSLARPGFSAIHMLLLTEPAFPKLVARSAYTLAYRSDIRKSTPIIETPWQRKSLLDERKVSTLPLERLINLLCSRSTSGITFCDALDHGERSPPSPQGKGTASKVRDGLPWHRTCDPLKDNPLLPYSTGDEYCRALRQLVEVRTGTVPGRASALATELDLHNSVGRRLGGHL